ncbi:MAG: sulfite exporter TauE/SafE family protein [Desulfobacteraceae bacterium]|nr:sulfite exporter TauE/SafE family protein [Desulfobacteraceae bacterium]
MYFSTADIEVAIWVPPLVAFVVSFFTSMGGVSGAFLLLPFQMSFLGYTHPSVSATNQLFNIVAIPSGVYRYWREGRMVWPLTWIVVLGTLPGVFIGAIVRVTWLPDPRMFKLFAAGVLLYIGVKMIRDVLTKGSGKNSSENRFQTLMKSWRSEGSTARPSTVTHFNIRRLGFTFYDESYDVSFPGIFFLSFIVGIIGGIYGIGGGAIIAPFFVTFFRLPVYIVAGAALMGTFVTSIAGVAFYQVIAPFYPHLSVAPDWLLGILFGIGGMAGMYLGARCQKFVPAKTIKWMLAGIMVLTAGKYVLAFFGY